MGARAQVGQADAPPRLDAQGLHGHLLGRPARSAADRRRAAARFAELVAKGTGEAPWAEHLRQQIYLGDAWFVERMQAQASPTMALARQPREGPGSQRSAPMTLQDCPREFEPRGEALHLACRRCGITMTQMAAELGLSVSRHLIAPSNPRVAGIAPGSADTRSPAACRP
jgi:putative transposase